MDWSPLHKNECRARRGRASAGVVTLAITPYALGARLAQLSGQQLCALHDRRCLQCGLRFPGTLSASGQRYRSTDLVAEGLEWQLSSKAFTGVAPRARRLFPKRPCPALHRKRALSGSDLRILGEGKSILHVDPKVADRIFDLAVAEKDLNGAKVAGGPIDDRCLRSAK